MDIQEECKAASSSRMKSFRSMTPSSCPVGRLFAQAVAEAVRGCKGVPTPSAGFSRGG
jgi:hypothetical protein